ncbi:MAG: prephenate dehydrogenase/arogenate dehydrogenase family protein [Candidatus Rokuibacteriota bacterium]|nr:MAG: prephenate dehydrogenase/arogenate dehydrogenase family protein [Candidatus Rokubacteria bacterium]
MIQRLAIVGVGLLGGSVAKAVRSGELAREIVGVGRDEARLGAALGDGTLDRVTTDLNVGVKDADFVLLALPVLAIEALLPRVWRAAPDGATVTDVGSTKGAIARVADRLAAGRALAFVGSHPMAGSERRGYGVARADLFRAATVVVTPTDRTEPRAVKAVAGFWEALGARVSTLDPETHDQAVAAISHLPHLVAYALVDGATRVGPIALALAARGFKDTTPIAAPAPDVWSEIFLANRAPLAAGLDVFRRALGELEDAVVRGSAEELRGALARIKAAREALE